MKIPARNCTHQKVSIALFWCTIGFFSTGCLSRKWSSLCVRSEPMRQRGDRMWEAPPEDAENVIQTVCSACTKLQRDGYAGRGQTQENSSACKVKQTSVVVSPCVSPRLGPLCRRWRDTVSRSPTQSCKWKATPSLIEEYVGRHRFPESCASHGDHGFSGQSRR